MFTDDELLKTVNPSLMFNKRLQLAYDRLLLCQDGEETEEYNNRWVEYLEAGGDRTGRDRGIDLENWKLHEGNGA